ncbi:unnamed protein product, partial [Mesorhabditis spiculigera]
MRYALLFSQSHRAFRCAELEGVCRALSLDFADFSGVSSDAPVQFVDVSSVELVEGILSRCVLLKAAFEFYCQAGNYEELEPKVQAISAELKKYDVDDDSWALRVRPFGKKKGVHCVKQARVVAEWLPLEKAPIDLKTPKNKFVVLEQYASEKDAEPNQLFFGREIGEGQGIRKHHLNLQDRCYIGNTTMDPELAFLQANITAIRSASVVLDPFCGTGGLLLPAAEFGASVIGNEINYMVAHARGKSSRMGKKMLTDESVRGNFVQYDTEDRFLSLIIADTSRHGIWADRPIFDAIVADPPYGVREKSRKIGPKDRKEHWTLPGTPNDEHQVRFPEKQDYHLDSVFSDLLDLAAQSLVVGGRVSFWFPVVLDRYSEDILPQHPAFRLVANCEQGLTTRTSRRLLTYEKTRAPLPDEKATTSAPQFDEKTFRDVVFKAQ